MPKRKLENGARLSSSKTRRVQASDSPASNFRAGLFDDAETLRQKYAQSTPYQHGVIEQLMDDELLRAVRTEISERISFTQKETDIYRIFQSGDLANLDGLSAKDLQQLPHLLSLRDALYSPDFRSFVADITQSGPLSGSKTDMSINIYTPGCHLLCHDDVIGTRRVSYILYLTDPDRPWQVEWGGALRLYPAQTVATDEQDGELQVPADDFEVSIPPAWNQLSFFVVQPGKSFHDVEEVYPDADPRKNKQRVRLAISGWFHLPQEGEPGYIAGEADRHAAQSSRSQLQAKSIFGEPPQELAWYSGYQAETLAFNHIDRLLQRMAPDNQDSMVGSDAETLSQDDCTFLLQYINPRYLTPDTVLEISEAFTEDSFIRLDDFLRAELSSELRDLIGASEPKMPPAAAAYVNPQNTVSGWHVAGPPVRQKYLYLLPEHTDPFPPPNLLALDPAVENPLKRILGELLPSREFRKWLALITRLLLKAFRYRVRRFRHGNDYQLATPYTAKEPRLELTLGLTPFGKFEEAHEGESHAGQESNGHPSSSSSGVTKGKGLRPSENESVSAKQAFDALFDTAGAASEVNNGGYEMYMAASDDEDDEEEERGNSEGVKARKTEKSDPAVYRTHTGTGARAHAARMRSGGRIVKPSEQIREQRTGGEGTSSDKQSSRSGQDGKESAIGIEAEADDEDEEDEDEEDEDEEDEDEEDDGEIDGEIEIEDEDDGAIFNMHAGWNRLSLVLRDQGTLRFVKYVTAAAGADRWDVTGEWLVDWPATDVWAES